MTASATTMSAASPAASAGIMGKIFGTKNEKADKGMSFWGATWRITAWIALAAAIAASVAFGIHFGLGYLAALGLGETALLASQIALGVVSALVSFVAAWQISKRVAKVLGLRALTKLGETLAAE